MSKQLQIEKLPTGIVGFDKIANGGLPKGRTTLIAGTSGSAKTVFAAQFLVEGILNKANESGVFVTFEESPDDIRRNMMSLGWNIEDWEQNGKWLFVDASPQADHNIDEVGDFDFAALLARIEYAVQKIGAKRIVLDSLGAVFSHFTNAATVRRELFRVATAVKQFGVTALMTAERTSEYGEIARYNVEEFVADNVIILRNVLDDTKRRRTMEILKFRGTSHQKGEFPFSVIPGEGIVVIALSALELKQRSSAVRITSGNAELDLMCGSGFFRDSIVLVSGATGTGKTLMTTGFLAGGARN
ncbi:MAG: circadian clock protein KaiC, partial [Methylobacter sp.]